MAVNFSENKIHVTSLLGAGSHLGQMDPKIGMITDHGTILSIPTGTGTVILGVGTGSVNQAFYPHELYVSLTNATTGFAWPSGDGSVLFGHNGTWPSGVPLRLASGSVYCDATGPHTFYR